MSFTNLTARPTGPGKYPNLPTGRFPDDLCHSIHDPILYSNGASQKIRPLDHVQVIRIDTLVSPLPPYSMTLQFPVISRLPNNGRIYFFYLSECHEGDTLSFVPTPLSGESVNGNVLGHTFNLYGTKALFACIAVGTNWIIHPFGNNIQNTASSTPMVRFDYSSAVIPTYGPPPIGGLFPTDSDAFCGLTGFSPEVVIVSGMEGFLVPNADIPAQAFNGFQCTKSGVYGISPILELVQDYTLDVGINTVGCYWANFYEFSSTGTALSYTHSPAFVPIVGNVPGGEHRCNGVHTTTQYYELTAGNYYTFSFTWDLQFGTIGAGTITGSATFQYIAPLPTPVGPTLMMSMAPGPSSLSSNVVVGSSSDSQVAKRSLQSQFAASSSSSNGGVITNPEGQPMFSLNAMENMVRELIRQNSQSQVSQQQQQPQSLVEMQSVIRPSSSVSSNAAGKKRARAPEPVGASSSSSEPPLKK